MKVEQPRWARRARNAQGASTSSEHHLELTDIQGNVVRSFGMPFAHHLFVHLGEEVEARRWVAQLLPSVPSAAAASSKELDKALNVALTFRGLEALGVDRLTLSEFQLPFRQGMSARAHILGDTGRSSPTEWEPGLGTGEAHVLVSVYGSEEATLAGALRHLRHLIESSPSVTVVHERDAALLPGAREHFGFSDGFSQPAVAGIPGGSGVRGRLGLWHSIPPGEFVLGYGDAEGCLPPAPAGPLGRNGTYLVYRELEQAVGKFRDFVASSAAALGRDDDWVASRIVGRWRDGTPLALSPDRPDPSISGDPVRTNDFDYADDPSGKKCPLGAHVRRTNPRNGIAFGSSMTLRHRIVRRGMPYGPPLAVGAPDDGTNRGLLFMCFNADIVRQFEFVQREWCLDGNTFGLGDDHDPLIGGGRGSGKMTVQGDPPVFLAPLGPFVTTRGGEYLYLPGLSALEMLARG